MSGSGNELSPAVKPVDAVTYLLEDDGSIPNSSLPLVVYPGALDFGDEESASICEGVFHGNGWGDSWRNGIYSFHHYHSTAHEVLGLCEGKAVVLFGGKKGVTVEIKRGDVAILPAGVGHKRLDASADLLVVGAYPSGSDCDLMHDRLEAHLEALERIRKVPLPKADPVYGVTGPLLENWKNE
jgi:uncharacterized protein YjlB